MHAIDLRTASISWQRAHAELKRLSKHRAELVPVSDEITEMTKCDAQTVQVHVGVGRTSVSRVPVMGEKRGGDPKRARQSVTPALRRQVVRRDHGHCQVPGCRNARFLDIHHLRPQSEGGRHEADNLLLLCGAHHRAQHRGYLIIESTLETGLTFRHADGTMYGGQVSPETAMQCTEAFQALRSLGFAETQARILLRDAMTHVGTDASSEDLLTEALRRSRRLAPRGT